MKHEPNIAAAAGPIPSEIGWGTYFTPEGNAVVKAAGEGGKLVFAAKRGLFGIGALRWTLIKSRGHEGLEAQALAMLNTLAPECRIPSAADHG